MSTRAKVGALAALPVAVPAAPAGVRRILGVDPGLRLTGFGVLDAVGSRAVYVASGVIATEAGALPERLRVIFAGIAEVVRRFGPTESAIEQVFVNVNPASTLLLGQARGAAVTALAVAGLSVAEYGTMQIKLAVAGHGRADKAAIQAMVVRLLALAAAPQADAADALACALTHAAASPLAAVLAGHRGAAAASGVGGVAARSATGATAARGRRRGAGLRTMGEALERAQRAKRGN